MILFLGGIIEVFPEIYRSLHREPSISLFKIKFPLSSCWRTKSFSIKLGLVRKDFNSKVIFFYGSEHCPSDTSRSLTLFYTILVLRSSRNTWLIPKVALVMDKSTLSLLTHWKSVIVYFWAELFSNSLHQVYLSITFKFILHSWLWYYHIFLILIYLIIV